MRYFWHPESECFFALASDEEVKELLSTADGALCVEMDKESWEKQLNIVEDWFHPDDYSRSGTV